jgi:hypothetical protein
MMDDPTYKVVLIIFNDRTDVTIIPAALYNSDPDYSESEHSWEGDNIPVGSGSPLPFADSSFDTH